MLVTSHNVTVSVWEDCGQKRMCSITTACPKYTDRHQVFGKSQGLKLSDVMGWNISPGDFLGV